ncbi:MAG: phosphotransferase [Kangiellaceae bacterium]|jgi:aminoglycoside/choline kinase family phosphotransferase|nr:phosphotransferase [Kangiellaceae bacterium]
MTNDVRAHALTEWVNQQQLTAQALNLTMVSGDASFRRYFRTQGMPNGKELIAVDSPPQLEPIDDFLMVTELLDKQGVKVPEIIAFDKQQGFMLQSDFGDRSVLADIERQTSDHAKLQTAGQHYHLAMQQLVKIQSATDVDLLADYDRALLMKELELFREWFLQKKLSIQLTADENILLDRWFELLVDAAVSQPKVTVHRDYHSRNLMAIDQQTVGVIDYQDSVKGPITYDIVSLLKDCYVRWPRQQQLSWLQSFYQMLPPKRTQNYSFAKMQRDFDWIGIQRHVKVVGIFCRLSLRDNKHSYLQDIPLTIAYLLEAMPLYQEHEEVLLWLEQRVKPVAVNSGLAWGCH